MKISQVYSRSHMRFFVGIQSMFLYRPTLNILGIQLGGKAEYLSGSWSIFHAHFKGGVGLEICASTYALRVIPSLLKILASCNVVPAALFKLSETLICIRICFPALQRLPCAPEQARIAAPHT
jgi:hypothetical protein